MNDNSEWYYIEGSQMRSQFTITIRCDAQTGEVLSYPPLFIALFDKRTIHHVRSRCELRGWKLEKQNR